MELDIAQKRPLPEWMNSMECTVRIERMEMNVNDFVEEKENANTLNKTNEKDNQQASCATLKRYRTRSSIVSQTDSLDLNSEVNRKNPRLATGPKPKPAFIEYKGKVEYYTEFYDIAYAADTLLTWVNAQQTNEMIPIAFDMEWPFTFQTGPGKTAVIQFCAAVDLCYVLHIANLKKLPAALVQLLLHDKVCLHGVNIKNDCRKLERDFPEVTSQKMVDQCIDLGVYCNKIMNTGGRWSMERLVWYLCRLKINKDKKVRNSKWHIMPLSPEQQIYAAIDVYISQVMYYKLKDKEVEKETEAQKFIEEYGEQAYIERQKLL